MSVYWFKTVGYIKHTIYKTYLPFESLSKAILKLISWTALFYLIKEGFKITTGAIKCFLPLNEAL